MRTRKILRLAMVMALGMACAPSSGEPGAAVVSASAKADSHEGLIDHIAPKRDSTGTSPARFEWTRVEGADRYAIRVWNEVDRLMWRSEGLTTNAIVRPEELQLDFGTYYWAVSAFHEGTPIADSGLAAFVVLEQ